MEQPTPSHPIRLVVTDDLVRSRLTVFFRLLLAIPHLFVLALWGTVAFVIAVINWFATLVKGQSPQGLHDFLANYLRYATRVEAYLLLAGNPFPPFFVGSRMSGYPIDLEIGAAGATEPVEDAVSRLPGAAGDPPVGCVPRRPDRLEPASRLRRRRVRRRSSRGSPRSPAGGRREGCAISAPGASATEPRSARISSC